MDDLFLLNLLLLLKLTNLMKLLLLQKISKEQSIVWFSGSNQYGVFPNTTANVLVKISEGKSIGKIGKKLAESLNLPLEETISFIENINQKIYLPNTVSKEFSKEKTKRLNTVSYKVVKFYKINKTVFKVAFQSEKEAFLIHPKFAHLEVNVQENYDFYYQTYTNHNKIFLYIDNNFIGSWAKDNVHYYQGKFSMEFVQNIHQKKEDEWMGVFHASAVSNGKKSMLFLGDSGNGKSTSLALLQANGFTCIADDFVPVDVKNQEVYSFPSAISIKKNSVPVLKELYPELEASAEYHLKALNKVVRYLPPNNSDYTKHLPCKALIFIKYQPAVELEVQSISNIEAFEQLVPDSWLSPKAENAQVFLEWFSKLPCYKITYSNNKKMITTVTQLFNNEL